MAVSAQGDSRRYGAPGVGAKRPSENGHRIGVPGMGPIGIGRLDALLTRFSDCGSRPKH
jgi:hypothetical protein